jgi:iron complex transport system substrate-binding protein
VGRAAEAEALVADVEERFAAAREEHPEFAGATGIVATPYQGTIFVYSPEDPRGRFMDALGFESVPEIDDLVTDGFGAELSMEQADLLEVDTLVWIIDDPVANMAELHDVEIYGRMAVVEDGREVPVVNLSELGSATSFQTVLSIPALLDGLVPMLAAAIDGDPATEVVQPEDVGPQGEPAG